MASGATHTDMAELLPWYVNGTLTGPEREQVDAHLSVCAECRSDLTFLEDVQRAAQWQVEATPAAPDTLGKTLALIDEFEREAGRHEREGGVLSWWSSVFSPSFGGVRWALAAQFIVILGLAGWLVVRQGPGTGEYSTLSSGTGMAGGVRLTVTFQPAATEVVMREVLGQARASIVAGPSAQGVYVVRLPIAEDDEAAVDAALEDLRRRADVIQFAEREP